jgi:hypothetical protein
MRPTRGGSWSAVCPARPSTCVAAVWSFFQISDWSATWSALRTSDLHCHAQHGTVRIANHIWACAPGYSPDLATMSRIRVAVYTCSRYSHVASTSHSRNARWVGRTWRWPPDAGPCCRAKGVRLAQKEASWPMHFCGNTDMKG